MVSKSSLTAFVNQRAEWPRGRSLSVILEFIEMIMNHVANAEICDWGSDDDGFDCIPKSAMNPVADQLSVLMNTQSVDRMGYMYQKPKPWKISENPNPVFIATLIALNFHLIDEPELYQHIESESQSYPWFSRFDRLKEHFNSISKPTALRLEVLSKPLLKEYSSQRLSAWSFLRGKLCATVNLIECFQTELDEEDVEKYQDTQRRLWDQEQIQEEELWIVDEFPESRALILRVQEDPILRTRIRV
jgi:hypothetical protein